MHVQPQQQDNLEQFRDKYGINGERVLAELTVDDMSNDSPSGYVVIHDRHGHTLVLNAMALRDHLCLDVHSFKDGEAALGGVMAMDTGQGFNLGPETPGTSHGWPATSLVAVLVGKQWKAPWPEEGMGKYERASQIAAAIAGLPWPRSNHVDEAMATRIIACFQPGEHEIFRLLDEEPGALHGTAPQGGRLGEYRSAEAGDWHAKLRQIRNDQDFGERLFDRLDTPVDR